jgi:glyoxylase I family protein
MTGVSARPQMFWSHVGLNCRDQAKTEEFYRRWFGFERARTFDIGGGQQIVFLRNGEALLELFPAAGDGGPPASEDGPQQPGTARHLAFQTDDVDAFLARIGEEASVSLGPMDFDDFIPGWRTVWLTDPDGVVVEVSQGYRDGDPPDETPSNTTSNPRS